MRILVGETCSSYPSVVVDPSTYVAFGCSVRDIAMALGRIGKVWVSPTESETLVCGNKVSRSVLNVCANVSKVGGIRARPLSRVDCASCSSTISRISLDSRKTAEALPLAVKLWTAGTKGGKSRAAPGKTKTEAKTVRQQYAAWMMILDGDMGVKADVRHSVGPPVHDNIQSTMERAAEIEEHQNGCISENHMMNRCNQPVASGHGTSTGHWEGAGSKTCRHTDWTGMGLDHAITGL